MDRPTRFESYRYLGDKRTQRVYDVDAIPADHTDDADTDDADAAGAGVRALVEELIASERFAVFSPDTLPEARNRGYRLHRSVSRP